MLRLYWNQKWAMPLSVDYKILIHFNFQIQLPLLCRKLRCMIRVYRLLVMAEIQRCWWSNILGLNNTEVHFDYPFYEVPLVLNK